MGRLAIRRVVYSGDKYSFESPYLNDGIVIMERRKWAWKKHVHEFDLLWIGRKNTSI